MSRFILSMLIVGLSIASASADSVPVPPGLQPGDTYQLAFVTSTSHNCLPNDISFYNNFVTSAAAAAGLGGNWFAIASTALVDARDNAIVSGPVYDMNLNLFATGFDDIWDGQFGAFIGYDEFGSPVEDEVVWTGTFIDGTSEAGQELGDGGGFDERAITGFTSELVPEMSNWIHAITSSREGAHLFYALSEPITVGVPEPASYVLAIISGLAGLTFYMRRRG